jgi:hypothetical protein
MQTTYIKQGSDIITQTYWTYTHCVHNASQWAAVDGLNAARGYDSGLAGDEWRWTAAMAFSLGAIMTLFFCGFLLLLMFSGVAAASGYGTGSGSSSGTGSGTGSGEVSVVGLLTAAALLLLFLLQEIAIVALISGTARVDPKAWSTAVFDSCSVKVERNTGFLFPVVCASLSGGVLLFAATAACLHVYRRGSRSPSQSHPQSQAHSRTGKTSNRGIRGKASLSAANANANANASSPQRAGSPRVVGGGGTNSTSPSASRSSTDVAVDSYQRKR